jgi:hypothetical protein
MERISEKTDSGVRALPAGAKVRWISTRGSKAVVRTEDNSEFVVSEEMLTSDLNIKDQLLQDDAREKLRNAKAALGVVILGKEAVDQQIKNDENEITMMRFELEALSLRKKRHEAIVSADRAKPVSLLGDKSPQAKQAANEIVVIERRSKVIEMKIEDLELSINRNRLNQGM